MADFVPLPCEQKARATKTTRQVLVNHSDRENCWRLNIAAFSEVTNSVCRVTSTLVPSTWSRTTKHYKRLRLPTTTSQGGRLSEKPAGQQVVGPQGASAWPLPPPRLPPPRLLGASRALAGPDSSSAAPSPAARRPEATRQPGHLPRPAFPGSVSTQHRGTAPQALGKARARVLEATSL